MFTRHQNECNAAIFIPSNRQIFEFTWKFDNPKKLKKTEKSILMANKKCLTLIQYWNEMHAYDHDKQIALDTRFFLDKTLYKTTNLDYATVLAACFQIFQQELKEQFFLQMNVNQKIKTISAGLIKAAFTL